MGKLRIAEDELLRLMLRRVDEWSPKAAGSNYFDDAELEQDFRMMALRNPAARVMKEWADERIEAGLDHG